MATPISHAGPLVFPHEGHADTNERFDQLYQSLAPCVWRWARQLGGPAIDVEDVVQEVFLLAYRGFPAFRGDSEARTWLYRITSHLVTRQRRRRRWLRSRSELASPVAETPPLPDEPMHAQQAEILLYQALDRLDERKRALLIAFELRELSGPEIARALGIKPATLWVQLHRARRDLRRQLEALNAR